MRVILINIEIQENSPCITVSRLKSSSLFLPQFNKIRSLFLSNLETGLPSFHTIKKILIGKFSFFFFLLGLRMKTDIKDWVNIDKFSFWKCYIFKI